MRDWLNYAYAFAAGLAAAAALYYLAAVVSLSGGMAMSVAAFVGFVIVMPIMGGLVMFGLVYPKITGDTLSGSDRLNAFAFAVITTIFFSSLFLSRMVPQEIAFPLFVLVMFFGGRILLLRRQSD